jgi:UrcA family protein
MAAWAAGATVTAVALTGGGFAKAAEPPPSKRVFIGDLDLRSDTGRKALLRRLRSAAQDVCFASGSERTLAYGSQVAATCVRVAVNGALSQAPSDAVIALGER